MYREFQDEIINGTPKYRVTDNPDNTKDISLANTVVNPGTPLNKATFANLQGDIYTETQYSTPTYSGNNMALNLPLTSYETGKIVRIKAPTTFAVHPTININQLGAKAVNAVLAQGVCYDLIYNGISFDVNIANGGGVDKYYTPRVSSTPSYALVQEDLLPKSWNTVSTGARYTKDGITIETDGGYYSSNYILSSGFDGDEQTFYQNNFIQVTNVKITLPQATRITKMKIKAIASASTWGIFHYKIQGSKDNTSWTDLYSGSAENSLREITLSNQDFYLYYRLQTDIDNSKALVLYELQVSEYYKPVPQLLLDLPLSSYESGDIIRIKSPVTNDKARLNINNLGEKEIGAQLVQGGNYTLVYDGTKFINSVATVEETVAGTNNEKTVTPFALKGAIGGLFSFKTGTISDEGIIPQTEGYSNYLYFVSVSEGYESTGSGNPATGITCNVDQTTRKVVCRISAIAGVSRRGESGTANYLEIAWN